jgi:hypothetical protein
MKRTFAALAALLLSSVCALVVACATQGDGNTDRYAQLDESEADAEEADDSATGGGPPDRPSQRMSSLDGDTRLDQLSDSEHDRMCDEMAGYFEDHLPFEEMEAWSCTMAGVTMAQFSQPEEDQELQFACAAARDECLAADDEEADSGEFDCNIPAQCAATVGEWEGCLTTIVEQFQLMMDETPACEEITIDGIDEALNFEGVERQPEACEVIEQKCPELLSAE